MEIARIRYRFRFEDGRQKEFELNYKADSLTPIGWVQSSPPEWTALDYHKCRNCPLDSNKHAHCPAALNLSRVVEECAQMDPLEPVRLEVHQHDRGVVISTNVQRGIGSLMGLVMATSDCPHTQCFRPIAKFHLPLGSDEETIYRALSVFLMGQFLRHREGQSATFDIDGLLEIYNHLEIVNTAMASRLKSVGERESGVQPLKEWDIFSGMFGLRMQDMLAKIRPLFSAYLD